MNWELLIGPVVGGIIGYITNGIAIKMLFRPLNPIHIFGIKLPFTPGIIPKEKGRLARSIGQVVGKELINKNVLEKVLLQENIYAQIDQKIDDVIGQYEASELTVKELSEKMIDRDSLEEIGIEVEKALTNKLYTKIVEMNLGEIAVTNLIKEVNNGLDKSLFGAFAFFINDSLIESIALKLEPIINQMVEAQGEQLIIRAVQREGEAFLNQPIMHITSYAKEKAALIKDIVRKAYTYFVQHNLAHALEIVDLSKVVEERINAFDTLELEKMILQIMAKELNAIIWLGALLGAVLGCIMSIV
ncbi:DUF445 domain-containing protein [Cellulosilyticum sp. I15G10I2]|uniref:DUF445 domain-containing protein n=1 Tax=Cellulosilyticum sp. I15G10I2 TaxID=1892843 RepID=UPI00085C2524|nr:DUF445 family protein [Cellulosilyticum sp. I15G10I2]